MTSLSQLPVYGMFFASSKYITLRGVAEIGNAGVAFSFTLIEDYP
jgi:hypothetical protein